MRRLPSPCFPVRRSSAPSRSTRRCPAGFGTLGGDLLVGNFGDGRINILDLTTRSDDDDEGAIPRGQLRTPTGAWLSIDGLN